MQTLYFEGLSEINTSHYVLCGRPALYLRVFREHYAALCFVRSPSATREALSEIIMQHYASCERRTLN